MSDLWPPQPTWGTRVASTITLYRDEGRVYYLQRESFGEDEPKAQSGVLFLDEDPGYRCIVHRVGINAAILWAVGQLGNGDPWHLRVDAGLAIMENKGYKDPNPVCWRYAERKQALAGKNSLAAIPSATNRRNFYGVSRSTLEAATRYAATAGRTLEDMVAGFVDMTAKMAPESATERPAVATELLANVQITGACHQFTYDYPATGKSLGLRRTVALSDEQMERVSKLAVHFDLTPTAFLRGLVRNKDLPGQCRRAETRLVNLLQPADIAFVCMDEEKAARIARAAQACGQTVDEFVAGALGGDVDIWEETMLVHPTTGELLEADCLSLYEDLGGGITAAPEHARSNEHKEAA